MSAPCKLPVHLLLTSLVLSACGGGGGGSPVVTPTPPVTYPLQAGIASRVNSGLTVNLSCTGTAQAVAFTGALTYTVAPATSATFEGQAALANSTSLTGTITVNGVSQQLPASIHTLYSSPANYATLGDDLISSWHVTTTPSAMPASVKVGDAGNDGVETTYTDSTKATVTGTITSTYAVKADTTSASVLITETAVNKDTSGTTTETDFVTYRLTTTGAISVVGLGIQGASGSGNTLTCTAP